MTQVLLFLITIFLFAILVLVFMIYNKLRKEEEEEALTEDELYDEAKEIAIQARIVSASLLQRRLNVGYARAARLLDMLEEDEVVGPAVGAIPRKVLIGKDEEQ